MKLCVSSIGIFSLLSIALQWLGRLSKTLVSHMKLCVSGVYCDSLGDLGICACGRTSSISPCVREVVWKLSMSVLHC